MYASFKRDKKGQYLLGLPISKTVDRSLLSDLEYAGGSPVRMYINPAQFLKGD